MKKRLFCDLDGSVCRLHDEIRYLERMYEEGFFLSLRPFLSVVEAINNIAKEGNVEVYILSSCISEQCREEKKQWVKKFLPAIPKSNYLLPDIGVSKALCLGHSISYNDVLLDDYNKNLEEWQAAGGHPIKLVNNINHKGLNGPLWTGECVYERDSAEKIVEDLKTMMESITPPDAR